MEERVKELLEKAKLTAGMAADGAVKAAGVVSQKGTQLVEKTKRSFQVFDLNNEVELLMREIGRMVYLTHTGAETDEAALEAKLAEIDEKYAQIAEIKAVQEAEKTTTVCPVCGKHLEVSEGYVRQKEDLYMALGDCPQHGLAFVKLQFGKNDEGKRIMTRSAALSDEQNPAYVHTKHLQWAQKMAMQQEKAE
jgi:hypothetical protein